MEITELDYLNHSRSPPKFHKGTPLEETMADIVTGFCKFYIAPTRGIPTKHLKI